MSETATTQAQTSSSAPAPGSNPAQADTASADGGGQQGQGATATTAGDTGGQQAQPAAAGTLLGGQAGTGPAANPGAKPEARPEGAPENYQFTSPEGATYDSKVIDTFKDLAREQNMTQAAAQKMLDGMSGVMAARQQENLESIRADWLAQSKADKEFGGDKLAVNLAQAKRALESFGTPELNKMLEDSGLGSHPEMVRLFYRVGKAIGEDGFVGGKPGSGKAKSYHNVIYGD